MVYEELIRRYSTPMKPVAASLPPKGSPVKPVRAVLFDVYGTLLISRAGDIGGAQSEAASRIDEIAELCRGYGLTIEAGLLLERFFRNIEAEKKRLSDQGVEFPEVLIEEIWMRVLDIKDRDLARLFALEFELTVNPVYPMPGLAKLLDGLRNRGLEMGIISNAQFYTPFLFSAHLGRDLEGLGFRKDLLFFSYNLGFGKPGGAAFETAALNLEKTGVRREETLFLGNDMLKDILPARAAGFQTVLFAGDSRSLNLREDDDRCGAVKPDMIITDLAQLLDCL
ncbi:MAG: hypothetical protein AVO39_02185 [delta proteobacterium MLS_D]|jgi:putative hydrolase of the HAD superfamily|nr:MAG: hypothetical protein AVO39_02185 [delta proteobacterium MLS_D]